MIKPDLVLCWPSHADYPLFRYNMERYRQYFNEVFIAFTQDTVQPDLRQSVMETMKNVTFVKPQPDTSRDDWRDLAVREVVRNFARNDHILFLEQDFLIKDGEFFERMLSKPQYHSVLYFEGSRIHPACALVERDIVMNTSLDFSARPPAYDHFGLFFKEVTERSTWVRLEECGLVNRRDFYHMAGLTQNYFAFTQNIPIFKPKEFLTYNYYTLRLSVPLHPEFRLLSEKIEQHYGFVPENEDKEVAAFFPKL